MSKQIFAIISNPFPKAGEPETKRVEVVRLEASNTLLRCGPVMSGNLDAGKTTLVYLDGDGKEKRLQLDVPFNCVTQLEDCAVLTNKDMQLLPQMQESYRAAFNPAPHPDAS